MSMHKIKFIKPWRGFEAGAIIEETGGVADLLVNRQQVAEFVQPSPAIQPKRATKKKRSRKTTHGPVTNNSTD